MQDPFDLLETDRSVELDECGQEVKRAEWHIKWQVKGTSGSLERYDIVCVQIKPIEGALNCWDGVTRQKPDVVASSIARAFRQFQDDSSLDFYVALTDHIIRYDSHGLKRVMLQKTLSDIAVDVSLECRCCSFGLDAIEMLEKLILPVVELIKQFGDGCVSFSSFAQSCRPARGQAIVNEGRDGVECRCPVWVATTEDGVFDTILGVRLSISEPFDEKVRIVSRLGGVDVSESRTSRRSR